MFFLKALYIKAVTAYEESKRLQKYSWKFKEKGSWPKKKIIFDKYYLSNSK